MTREEYRAALDAAEAAADWPLVINLCMRKDELLADEPPSEPPTLDEQIAAAAERGDVAAMIALKRQTPEEGDAS